jgi:hypothetical protein
MSGSKLFVVGVFEMLGFFIASLHHNDYGSIHMGAGTMRKTAPTGKIS